MPKEKIGVSHHVTPINATSISPPPTRPPLRSILDQHAVSSHASLPTTGVGALGRVVKGFVTDNVWLGTQIHDANSVSGKFDFDTAQEGEWLKVVEVGYTPSFEQRMSLLVQFT